MAWTAYQLVLRLLSPMHIGAGKVGSLQITRPYVTGRVWWGALTARLTRALFKPARPEDYAETGRLVNEQLAFTYFYLACPTTGGAFAPCFPWDNPDDFDYRFRRSYASTSLVYPQQAAAETTLHEIEYMSPRRLDNGEPVFLLGYLFARDDCHFPWTNALSRLQFGGERGYGWGAVRLQSVEPLTSPLLFGALNAQLDADRPRVTVPAGERLLAHAQAKDAPTEGMVEPLVGREWRAADKTNRHSGAHVEYAGFYMRPGAKALADTQFTIGPFGVWVLE